MVGAFAVFSVVRHRPIFAISRFINHLESSQMKNFKFSSTTLPAMLLAAFLATAMGCASTSTHESTGQYVDDTVITTRVKAVILDEPGLKSAEINVETFKGVVQLSGFVSSQANINRAAELARGVKGVTSVKNDMRVKG
jgi:hypothetical protein